MSIREFIIGLFFVVFQSTFVIAQNNINNELKSTVFEPENISTDKVEYSSSISPSGLEIYFARSNDKWGMGDMKSSIYYSIK